MYRLIAHLSQRMKNIYKILRKEALSEQYTNCLLYTSPSPRD